MGEEDDVLFFQIAFPKESERAGVENISNEAKFLQYVLDIEKSRLSTEATENGNKLEFDLLNIWPETNRPKRMSNSEYPKYKNFHVSLTEQPSNNTGVESRKVCSLRARLGEPLDVKFSNKLEFTPDEYLSEKEGEPLLSETEFLMPNIPFLNSFYAADDSAWKTIPKEQPSWIISTDFMKYTSIKDDMDRECRSKKNRVDFIYGKGKYYNWLIEQIERIQTKARSENREDRAHAETLAEWLDLGLKDSGIDWREIPLVKRERSNKRSTRHWYPPWMSRKILGQSFISMANYYYNFKQRDDRALLSHYDFYCLHSEVYDWLVEFNECVDFSEMGVSEEQYEVLCEILDKADDHAQCSNVLWRSLEPLEFSCEQLSMKSFDEQCRNLQSYLEQEQVSEYEALLEELTETINCLRMLRPLGANASYKIMRGILKDLKDKSLTDISEVSNCKEELFQVFKKLKEEYKTYSHSEMILFCDELLQSLSGKQSISDKMLSETYIYFCLMRYENRTSYDFVIGVLLEKISSDLKYLSKGCYDDMDKRRDRLVSRVYKTKHCALLALHIDESDEEDESLAFPSKKRRRRL